MVGLRWCRDAKSRSRTLPPRTCRCCPIMSSWSLANNQLQRSEQQNVRMGTCTSRMLSDPFRRENYIYTHQVPASVFGCAHRNWLCGGQPYSRRCIRLALGAVLRSVETIRSKVDRDERRTPNNRPDAFLCTSAVLRAINLVVT